MGPSLTDDLAGGHLLLTSEESGEVVLGMSKEVGGQNQLKLIGRRAVRIQLTKRKEQVLIPSSCLPVSL